MVKTVGKIFYSIIFLCSGFVWPMKLSVTSSDGTPLEQVARGVPFVVKVSVEGGTGSGNEWPTLDGVDKGSVFHAGLAMQLMNGHTSRTYTYEVSLDTLGRHTIGPAHLTIDGDEVTSNKVSVRVGEGEVVDQAVAANKRAASKDTVLELLVDKDRLMVGQQVKTVLRFYHHDKGIRLTGLSEPVIPGAKRRGDPVRTSRQIKKDGKNLMCDEITFTWVVTEPGELVVPACKATYEKPLARGFFFFSKMAGAADRVYSNAQKLFVEPLPQTTVKVDAVGECAAFEAMLETTAAHVGEGVVLSVRVEGDFDFDGIEPFSLHQLPAGLKWYFSKSSSDQPRYGGLGAKVFEYIIQGVLPGSYEIPSLSFTYFDLVTKRYKTCLTDPLYVSMDGQVVSVEGEADVSDEHERDIDENTDVFVVQLTPLNEHGLWYPTHGKALPLPFFVLMALLPALLVLLVQLHKRIAQYLQGKKMSRKKTARKALSSLDHLQQQEHGAVGVHAVMMTFFADCLGIKNSAVDDTSVLQYLQTLGLRGEQLAEWHAFSVEIVRCRFGGSTKEMCDNDKLLQVARQWVRLVKEL